jgi:hypothetical protein
MPWPSLEQRRSRRLAPACSFRPRVEELEPRCLLNATNRLFAADAHNDLIQHAIPSDRLRLYRSQLDLGVSRPQVVKEIENTLEYQSHLMNKGSGVVQTTCLNDSRPAV